MKKATIIREIRSDQGTEGRLITDGFSCFTMELPWRNNARSISCIPEGTYHCRCVDTPRHGFVYTVEPVTGRGGILIHSGNWAGDTRHGWKADSEGCILLGRYRGIAKNQRAVLVSRLTVHAFMDAMEDENFELDVKEAFNQ